MRSTVIWALTRPREGRCGQASFDQVDLKSNKPRSEAQRRGRVSEEVALEQIRRVAHLEGERGLAATSGFVLRVRDAHWWGGDLYASDPDIVHIPTPVVQLQG